MIKLMTMTMMMTMMPLHNTNHYWTGSLISVYKLRTAG